MIEAYDTSYPDNTAITQATIDVRRNLNAPVFNPSDYVTRIADEHIAVGSSINITVTATDEDDPVSTTPYLPSLLLLTLFLVITNYLDSACSWYQRVSSNTPLTLTALVRSSSTSSPRRAGCRLHDL